MKKWLLLGSMMVTAFANAAVIETKGSEFLNEMVAESLNALPSSYLDSVSKTITVTEQSFKSDALFKSEDLCKIDEGVKFGVTKKFNISISSRLIQLAQNNSSSFKCGHKSFRNMLKAVIIHELTHVKDNQEKISVDPDFQRIVGMKKVTGNSKKHLMNQNSVSSPDAYEFANLEESLAVNTEYLVLDSEFECRKPATANFLSKRLGISLKGDCNKNYKVLAQSAFLEDSYQLAVNIDPKRVYQIHYLFAGKGTALMSRWGHAMFRLIVCAPHRKVAGPECLNDVSHHLALSYRAYMSDLNMSYSKGVFGGYPSQLFVLRYLEVQQEYTKLELRDLYSAPLKMTADQKREFIDLTIERYWTYQGRYYFLDNNCGTETVKHLKVVLTPEEENLVGSITPLKIFNDIVSHSSDLADENLKDLSREQMMEKKFLTGSMFDELNESYQFLRKYLPSFSYKSMQDYLKKTKAEVRHREYEDLIQASANMEVSERKQVAMKLVHFERYLASRFLMEVPKKAIKLMDKDADLKNEVMKMGQGMKLLSIQPWEVVKSHYGVPVADEFENQFPVFIQNRQKEIKMTVEAQMTNLQNILGRDLFESELKELEELKSIKRLTSDFINSVNNI
jgi:hypothetical protein